MIRPEDQRLLQPLLLPGERLLWAGRPKRRLPFRATDLYLVPMGLFFAALPFWDPDAWPLDDLESVAYVLFFAALGLYAVFGRFFHEARLRSGLLYAVSDRRVILLETRRRRRSEWIELAYLPMLELDRHEDGRGTLRFDVEDEGDSYFSNDYRMWAPSGSNRLAFEEIENPQMVCNLIAGQSERRRSELLDATDPLFLR
jgi:hypothetical protein